MWYQIFICVSRFQCGTKYSFKLDCRIEGIIESIIECIIEGRIEGRIIYTVQASKYGCHRWLCPWSEIPMKNVLEGNTRIFLCLLECEVGTVKTGQQNMFLSGVWVQCFATYPEVGVVCWMCRCIRTTWKYFCARYSMLLEKGTPGVAIYRSSSSHFASTLEGSFENMTTTTISDASKGKNLQKNLTGIETFECFGSEGGGGGGMRS